jgi:hypothetical protein
MSRHITLAAFLATLAVVVPAAWHAPDADIPTDGPQLRPKQSTLHVGGATISVDLDRGVLMSGGKLKVTLVGTADTPRKVALDVREMQDNGIGPERVENPPTEIVRRRVHVEAAPGGGKPTEIVFEPRPWGMKAGRMQWFDIDVTPAGKRGEAVSYSDSDDGETLASAASVGVAVWGGNSLGMTVEAPASVPAGDAFTVKVHVKNTARKPIESVNLRIGGPNLSYNGMEGLMFYGEDNPDVDSIDESTGGGDEEGTIAPGAERVYEYKVTPKEGSALKLGLLVKAEALVVLDEKKGKYQDVAAMDAITVQRTEPAEPAKPAPPVASAAAAAPAVAAPAVASPAVASPAVAAPAVAGK